MVSVGGLRPSYYVLRVVLKEAPLYNNNTALTRLIPFLFVVMLLFISLTTTGCGFVDNNDSEEITIERVLRYEPESDEHIADEASTADQAVDDEEGAGVGSASGDPYGNPVKDNK